MKKKLLLSLLFAAVSMPSAFSQADGYWVKDRATTKEIVVGARDRILVSTEDLPAGTTEVVYRITLLDENQQMAGSLVSVLKAIPDPTGISQGSAGAVFLLSKVSGDDVCKYAIFSNNSKASTYIETGNTDKACLVQNNPVSKDAKNLSLEKSTCFESNSSNMWFG